VALQKGLRISWPSFNAWQMRYLVYRVCDSTNFSSTGRPVRRKFFTYNRVGQTQPLMQPVKVCQLASTNGRRFLPETHGHASPTSLLLLSAHWMICSVTKRPLQELRLPHIVYLLGRRPRSLLSFSPARNYMYTFVFHSLWLLKTGASNSTMLACFT
jgi:hypothetical protein